MAIDLICDTAAAGTTEVEVDPVRGDYTTPAVDLLPPGPLIWRREEGTVTWQVLEALAYLTYRANRRSDVWMRERMPSKAADMLPEWEEMFGLPDDCGPLAVTIPERRESLVAKVAAHAMSGGEHFDAVGEALGYTVRLQSLFKPFLAGESAVGDQIQRWPYWWAIRTTKGARDEELTCRYQEISRLWAEYTLDFHDWDDWEVVPSALLTLNATANNGQAWVFLGPSGGGGAYATGDFGENLANISGGVPAGIDWQGVAFGDGRFVGVGDDEVMVAIPPDLSSGGSWVSQTFGTTWRGVAYGEKFVEHGDRFVILGDAGDLRTSIDKGTTWVVRTTGTTEDLYHAAFHEGLWVIVGENGEILTSIDGCVTFTARDSNVVVDLHSVAWGNGRWVAVGNSGKICTSTNGIDWVVQTVVSGLAMWGVAYSVVGGFCIVGHSAKFWTSTTGLDFVEGTAPGAPDILKSVTTDDEGRWWACGLSGKLIKIETEHWYRLTQEF